jgi:hypothetical protein
MLTVSEYWSHVNEVHKEGSAVTAVYGPPVHDNEVETVLSVPLPGVAALENGVSQIPMNHAREQTIVKRAMRFMIVPLSKDG